MELGHTINSDTMGEHLLDKSIYSLPNQQCQKIKITIIIRWCLSCLLEKKKKKRPGIKVAEGLSHVK